MNEVVVFFARHGYILELTLCSAAVTRTLEKRERFWRRFAEIFGSATLFSVFWSSLPQNLYTESLRTFILWLIAAAGIYRCFQLPEAWAVFYATAAGTLQHITYQGAKLVQDILFRLIGRAAMEENVYPVLFLSLFFVFWFVFSEKLKERKFGVLPRRTLLWIFVGYQLSLNIFVNLFNLYSSSASHQIYTLYSAFDEVTAILLFFLLCELLERSDAEWENAVLQQVMRQQKQQMELSKETVELINIKCHDIKKQLRTLGKRMPEEELDELKKAVDVYDSVVKTGNETLDVLLAERSILCKGREIQLDSMVDGAKLSFLKPGEIYSLLGNALDNAIEAVTPLEPEKRYIGLQIREERGMLLIRMENCMAEQLRFVDGLPQTTKGDARWHGFGVRSIRRIVEQHGGTLTFRAQDGVFRMAALIPMENSLGSENSSSGKMCCKRV